MIAYKIKINFLLLLVAALLAGCEKNDKDDDTPVDQGSMEIIKDGISTTVKEFNNTLLSEFQNGQSGRRLDLRCNYEGGTFILSVSNWDWQNPPNDGVLNKIYDTDFGGPNTSCKDIDGASYCDGALGTYLITFDNQYSTIDDTDGFIAISSNDPLSKTVSGSFDFVVENLFTNDTINFKGNFTNLRYK